MAAGTRLVCSGAKREIVSGCYRLHRFNQFSREKGATAAGRILHSFHWAARRVSFEERWSLKCHCAIVPLCLAFCQRYNQILVPLCHCATVPRELVHTASHRFTSGHQSITQRALFHLTTLGASLIILSSQM